VAERAAAGHEAASHTPPSAHSNWQPARDRPDPVGLLEAQNTTREPDLVPVRHGRMLASPFTFYRGAGKIMAADLQDTPIAGLDVQLCGDAHLSNFGLFASPERTLLFDLNDFDETLPGPFEYDVKRMAASFTIAARNNGFAKADIEASTLQAVAAYRQAMAEFAQMRTMDVWHSRLDENDVMQAIKAAKTEAQRAADGKKGTAGKEAKLATKAARQAEKTRVKARTRDSLQALSKLSEVVDGSYRIISQSPIIIPERDLRGAYGMSAEEAAGAVRDQFRAYRARCATTGACCLSASRSLTRRGRWSVSAAWAPGLSSSCYRDATPATRCSFRSRRQRRRCSKTTLARASAAIMASEWCAGSE
jgi:Uncharacterized protein conserved in bacteria (DUF2252)